MDRRALIFGSFCMAGAGAIGLQRVLAAEERPHFALSGQLTQGGWARGVVPRGTAHLALNGRSVQIAPDGRFLIAFDRDAGPVARIVAERADGTIDDFTVPVAARAWQIEHIPIGPRPALRRARNLPAAAPQNWPRSMPPGGSSAERTVGGKTWSGRSSAAFRAGLARSGSIMAPPAAIIPGLTSPPARAAPLLLPPLMGW